MSISIYFRSHTNKYIENIINDLKYHLEKNSDKIKIIEKGQLVKNYKESDVANYMKNQSIDILINLNMGLKNFTAYTMDLTKKYIDIVNQRYFTLKNV